MMEPNKRKPTLADAFINHRYTQHDRMRADIPLKTIGDLQLKAMKASKYVFDDQASIRVGEVVRDIPDLLIREARFARAPYDLTWIEWNSNLFWTTIYEVDNQGYIGHPDSPARIGIIIDGEDAYMIAGGTVQQPTRLDMCYVTDFQYRLNTDPELYNERIQHWLGIKSEDGLTYKDNVGEFFWGSSFHDLRKQGHGESLWDITKHFRLRFLGENFDTLQGDTTATRMAKCSGDLRNIVAVLLMLNRPSITQYKQTLPNSRGWLRNKSISYLAHTSVTVSLDPQPILKLIGTRRENEDSVRWHKVEGHYCHNKDARDYLRIAGCIHDWVDTDPDWIPLAGDYAKSEVNHWVCSTCEGKRWWREYPHGRGDRSKGIVVKDQYNVKP